MISELSGLSTAISYDFQILIFSRFLQTQASLGALFDVRVHSTPPKPPNTESSPEQGSRLGLDFVHLNDVRFIQITLFSLKRNFKDASFKKTLPAFIPVSLSLSQITPMLTLILTRAQCYTVLIGFACVDMSFGKLSSITVIRTGFSHQTDQANWSMLVTHQVVVKTVTSPTAYLRGGIQKAGSQKFLQRVVGRQAVTSKQESQALGHRSTSSLDKEAVKPHRP